MKIQVACPECLRSASLDSSRVGKQVRCKGCGHVFKVLEDESEADLDSGSSAEPSWLDDGADGDAAEPASMVARGVPRALAGGGPSLGLMIGVGAGGALLLSLLVGFFVFGGRRAPAPEPEQNRQPEPGLFDRALTAVTGYDAAADPAQYPDLGPLPPPLLPPPAPRDLSAHERRSRALAASIDRMAGILATVHDAPSMKLAGDQYRSEGQRMAEEQQRNPPPFQLTFAEEDEVLRRTAVEIRGAVARLRQESQRIAGLPELGAAGAQLVGLADRLAVPLEAALKQAEGSKPSTGPPPHAEIFVQLQSADDADFFRIKLKGMLEAWPGYGMQGPALSQDGAPRASFRVWPVDAPNAFARQIPFGQATVKGRQIFLKAEAIPSDELAATRDALKQAEEERKRESEAREAEFKAKMAGPRDDPNDPAPPDDADELTKALFATRSSNVGKRREGVAKIAKTEPDDARRDEVHKHLEALLADADGFFVQNIMKAMVQWRTDDTVPALIKVLDHSSFGARWEAEEILGELGDPRAAKPLVARLKEDGIKVEPALRALGPAAEPALIELLRDSDPTLRSRACDLLRDVGGKDALEAMMSLPADRDIGVQSAARRAMRAISARVGPVAPLGKNNAKKAAAGKP